MFKKTILPNGLRVLTVPMQGVTTVTILVMADTGSNNEDKAKNGISHFLEHMFFKGTTKRPTSKIIAEEVDQMGAYTNAFTGKEYTGYYIKAPAHLFDEALDLLADIYNNSLVSQEEVEKERGVIIQEIRMYNDRPERILSEVFDELLYGDQPAGWKIAGSPEIVEGMRADDLKDYFMRQYTAENSFVVVSGNHDEDDMVQKVSAAFSGIRNGETRKRPSIVEEQSAPAVKIFFKETDQTRLMIGYRAFGVHDPMRVPASVLAHILGGSMASRLWEEIREKRGLAYSVHTSFDSNTTYGEFSTYAGAEHHNAEETIRLILAEYSKIREGGISDAELMRAKESMKGRMALSLEASDDLAFYVGGEEVQTGHPLTIEEVFAKIDRVLKEDIKAVTERIFTSNRLNLAIVGPHTDEEKFQKILIG